MNIYVHGIFFTKARSAVVLKLKMDHVVHFPEWLWLTTPDSDSHECALSLSLSVYSSLVVPRGL